MVRSGLFVYTIGGQAQCECEDNTWPMGAGKEEV